MRSLIGVLLVVCACDDGTPGVDPGADAAVDAAWMDAEAIDAGLADAGVPDTGLLDGAPSDAAPVDAAPTPPMRPSDPLYDPAVVQIIRLTIAPDDWAAMHAALPERVYVPATFQWRDMTVERVGVRFKGNSSSNPDSPFKRSFLIKFAEFVDGQRFLGLRRIALDNGIQFGSLFSEPFITRVLRAEGVIAPRANYAMLELNGAPHGVYVNVERIDEAFLVDRFGPAVGQLYKCDEGGPGADLSRLPRPADYARAFEPKTHEDTADHADIAALVDLIHDSPAAGFGDLLEEHVMVEPFLRFMAVAMLAGAFDQYTGWNPHNYYLYADPQTRRWHYLPWDLDVGFADDAFGQIPVLDGWNAAYPIPRVPRPLLQRILEDEQLLARYRAHADRILEAWFRPTDVAERLRAQHALIEPFLADDPFPQRRATNPGDRDLAGVVESQIAFARARYAQARAELDDPMIRPPQEPPPQLEPMPGPPSADAPSDLEVIGIDGDGVALRWTDNADGEAGHVVQRCEGAGCEDFVNRVGLPGPNSTEAIDDRVASGRTYRYRVYAVRPTPRGPEGSGVSNVATAAVP